MPLAAVLRKGWYGNGRPVVVRDATFQNNNLGNQSTIAPRNTPFYGINGIDVKTPR